MINNGNRNQLHMVISLLFLSISFIFCLPFSLLFHQTYFLLFCEQSVINFGQGVMRDFAHFCVMIMTKAQWLAGMFQYVLKSSI